MHSNLSQRLKELRQSHNISQKNLGSAVSLSMQAICDIEKGRRSTTADKLIIIADFFDVSLDYLVGRSDDPKRY
ncbi:MAG: helix-turn-helix transcriptional regulator [Eubacteriales bacterium]|nr:helix-turn-helix transcriptional regulator [Eubacteriales bacterium]